MNIKSQIESILFVASKPLTIKKIAQAIKRDLKEVEKVIEELKIKYNNDNSGIYILSNGSEVQMSSNPKNIEFVDMFVKNEINGELTKAQLETLTVIAYQGPISKPELEQIRGVNCSLILRNLLLRGLIEEKQDNKTKQIFYSVSFDFIRFLGINNLEELPNYDKLHNIEIESDKLIN